MTNPAACSLQPAASTGRVYAYIRVSTAEQGDSGLGLMAQLRSIKEYCARNDLAFDPDNKAMFMIGQLLDEKMTKGRRTSLYVDLMEQGVYLDVASAKMPMKLRPAGKELLVSLEPGDVLIGTRLDRVFRNLLDCCEVYRLVDDVKAHLHLVDLGGMALDLHTPIGFIIVHMMAVIAEWERMITGQRTREAQAEAKRRGQTVWMHTAPCGWRWVSVGVNVPFKLAPDPVAVAQIEHFRRLKDEGLSIEKIWRKTCARKGGYKMRLWVRRRAKLSHGDTKLCIGLKETAWGLSEIERAIKGTFAPDPVYIATPEELARAPALKAKSAS